jgi:FixJ family two-component response regulator
VVQFAKQHGVKEFAERPVKESRIPLFISAASALASEQAEAHRVQSVGERLWSVDNGH